MKRFLRSKSSVVTVMLLVGFAASGCGGSGPTVVTPEVSPEDQRAAAQSVSEHDSEEYAKSMAEQNGAR